MDVAKDLEEERRLRRSGEDERLRLKDLSMAKACKLMAADYDQNDFNCEQKARDELAATVLYLEDELLRMQSALEEAQGNAAGSKAEKALQADVALLLKELDAERAANIELIHIVNAAQAEAAEAAERVVATEKKLRELKQQKSSRRKGNDPNATHEDLVDRIQVLKSARDKLIEALDAQAMECERLGGENAALAAAIQDAKEATGVWERQTQDAIAQSDRLKDIIEESAAWMNGVSNEANGAGSSEQRCQELEQRLLVAEARNAELEVQVKALCAELTRVVGESGALHRAIHPALRAVEERLGGLLSSS